jgi:formate hydrogenlyase transcriptional activator
VTLASVGSGIIRLQDKSFSISKSGHCFYDPVVLTGYHWPGNIRELQNVIERAMILCDSDTFLVEEAWLKPEAEPWIGLQPLLSNQERELIEAALAETRGRISGPDGAARRLGVPRTTLEYKIKSLRIDKYRFRVEARELSSKW